MPNPPTTPTRRSRAILIAVLVGYAGVLAYCATLRLPNIGEASMVATGIWSWRRGDFEPGRASPLLPRLVAAAPLAGSDAILEPYHSDQDLARMNLHYSLAFNLLVQNEGRGAEFLRIARWTCIPFALLGAWLSRRWASELYGDRAGWLALFAWCVCPNVFARAHLAAPDIPAASLGLLAGYTFWRWLEKPTYARAYLAGLAQGLALLADFAWMTLLVVWPLFAVIRYLSSAPGRRFRVIGLIGQLGLMLLAGLTVVNVAYRFEGFGTRNDVYAWGLLQGNMRLVQLGKGRGLPVPLPGNFVLAIKDRERAAFGNEQWLTPPQFRSWFDRTRYVYAFVAIRKTPIGFLLTGLALAFGYLKIVTLRAPSSPAVEARNPVPTATTPPWLAELMLLAPAVAVLSVAALFPIYNYHLTHVFVAIPFLYIWLAQSARWFTRATWRRGVFLAIMMLWVLISSLVAAPNWLEYVNEFATKQTLPGAWGSDFDLGPDMDYLPDSLELKGY